MKIVQVLAGNEDGGLEKHVIELTHHLVSVGIDVCVVAHPDFAKFFKTIPFIPLDLTRSRFNPLILLKLYFIICHERPNIVHTQANKATNMVIAIKRFLSCKIVSTLHNYKKDISAFEKSDFVITVSDKIGEKLQTPYKCTIYNGIVQSNIETINLKEHYKIINDPFILCSVGRFVAVKRFDVLIQALAKLTNIHLILVGDGYESKKLQASTKELNIASTVTFTGSLPKEDVLRIIKNSHLFVMTSEREGFPYTFVETMLCKTPFISTPVSDIEKFISSKYITPCANVKQLAEKIEFVQQHYDVVRNDFKSIFDLSKQEFSIETMTKKTIEIYHKVLNTCDS